MSNDMRPMTCAPAHFHALTFSMAVLTHLFLSEVFPTSGIELPNTGAFRNLNALGRRLYLTDLRYRNPVYAPRQVARILRFHGKQQFEIFASMEGQQQRIQGATTAQLSDATVNGNL